MWVGKLPMVVEEIVARFVVVSTKEHSGMDEPKTVPIMRTVSSNQEEVFSLIKLVVRN